MKNKSLEIDMIAGSQLRDTQGEMLSVEGADISDLQNGKGRLNDNHGKGFFNSIGRVTSAKKIFKAEDCDNERQTYYWEKVKSPFIYVKGKLYDDSDHPNARAAAAILRNIHKSDCPLRLKASVEGGVQARGSEDKDLLARTKIHSVALTFTPANNATLVEPTSLEKSSTWEEDEILIKSVVHLAKTNVPSFRHITRRVSAEKLMENLNKIQDLASSVGIEIQMPYSGVDDVVKNSIQYKLRKNIEEINSIITSAKRETKDNSFDNFKMLFEKFTELRKAMPEVKKALTAGYGGAAAPTDRVQGAVVQTESLDTGFKYVTCKSCGNEQVYMKNQVKCRKCQKSLPFDDLVRMMV